MKKSVIMFAGILLAFLGLVCISACIFHQGKNQTLLNVGLLCNSLAFLLHCIARHIGG